MVSDRVRAASPDRQRRTLSHGLRRWRSMSRALSTRRCRVSGVLAPSMGWTYQRLWLYDRPSKNCLAAASPASASPKSGGSVTSRGAGSASMSTSISSPAATRALARTSALPE